MVVLVANVVVLNLNRIIRGIGLVSLVVKVILVIKLKNVLLQNVRVADRVAVVIYNGSC